LKNIERYILKGFDKKLKKQKVLLVFGARRVGKTHLIKQFLKNRKESYVYLNGEDIQTHELLSRQSVENYRQLMGDKKLLFIDEAQKIQQIGEKLKLMVDEIENLKVIVSGSSSFDIIQSVGEPLTGRKTTYHLYPFSEEELAPYEKASEQADKLKERLIFGVYPEMYLMDNKDDKEEYLNEMVSSYLLKDILIYDNIKNAQKIYNLLKMIAFQIGSEVSFQELGKKLGISKNTVERYLDLLTKVFILHRVDGYSKNLRKEITKSPRYYFIDNGLRNAVISNFNGLEQRNDIGQLWENYWISERIKFQEYHKVYSTNHFWRTYNQQEIDWVEDRDGKLFAFELKWSKEKTKIPSQWAKAYPDSEFNTVNQWNYKNWLLS